MEMSDEYRMKLELLKRLFQMLTRGRALDDNGNLTQDSPEILDLRSPSYRIGTESSSTSASVKSLGSISIGTGGSGHISMYGLGRSSTASVSADLFCRNKLFAVSMR